jgi:hypothetical protein
MESSLESSGNGGGDLSSNHESAAVLRAVGVVRASAGAGTSSDC